MNRKINNRLSIPRQNSFVVFDTDSIKREIYEEYFQKMFPEGKLFVFLGEIPNAHGHCILTDLENGLISGMWHTDNFREANENEV